MKSQRAVIVGNRELSKAQRCDSPVVYSITIYYLVSIYKGSESRASQRGAGQLVCTTPPSSRLTHHFLPQACVSSLPSDTKVAMVLYK